MLGSRISAPLAIGLALFTVQPVFAAGEIIITHAKALAGKVTPGDAAGYPVSLTWRGAYQLATALYPSANQIGIQILAPEVTIDLNGFTLFGAGVASHGIVGNQPNITIRNGTITRFKFDGVNGDKDFWMIDNMRVVRNGREGIRVGINARIEDSIISENGGIGIIGSNLHIENNQISLNGKEGIWTTVATVLGNHLYANGLHGILSTNFTGYGNNTLYSNNFGGAQVFGGFVPLHPNACSPACP